MGVTSGTKNYIRVAQYAPHGAIQTYGLGGVVDGTGNVVTAGPITETGKPGKPGNRDVLMRPRSILLGKPGRPDMSQIDFAGGNRDVLMGNRDVLMRFGNRDVLMCPRNRETGTS